jgi:hypothetical protein
VAAIPVGAGDLICWAVVSIPHVGQGSREVNVMVEKMCRHYHDALVMLGGWPWQGFRCPECGELTIRNTMARPVRLPATWVAA